MAAAASATARIAPRLLVDGLSAPESLADYRARGGYAAPSWGRAPAELLDSVEASGLRGRGGSAFPAGRKWRSVAAEPGPRALLVNGAETEPASGKDRLLLTLRPHLVVEGALLAARAVEAQSCVFYLHAGAGDERAAIADAMRELHAERWPLPRWRIAMAPPGYVAGEESAAIQRCNGKAAKPTFKPPLAYQRGIDGRPTLVHNVETLANIPGIARDGGAAFRAVGTAASPGSLLITLSGAVNRPGVYEVPGGTSLQAVLEELGGGTPGKTPVQAVLPGGYFAGWIDGAAVRRGITLDLDSLRAHGATLGAGTIVVVPESVCGLAQAAALLRFFAEQSVRQCGPCTYGTSTMAEIMERLALGRAEPSDLERLQHYADLMLPRRGACGHLDGATIAARTALQVFDREIAQHHRGRSCGRPWQVLLPGLEGYRGRPSA